MEGVGAEGVADAAVGATPVVRVFISYAHESEAHAEAVRELWVFLRANGLDAKLDRVAAQRRQDWTLWMEEQVEHADHILVIASPAYKRRAGPHASPDEGRGVQYETLLIRNLFYKDQRALGRLLPVVLPGDSPEDLPGFLAPAIATVYRVSAFTVAGAESLLRVLTRQDGEVEPPLGPVPVLGSREHHGLPRRPVLRHDVWVEVAATPGGELATSTYLAGTLLGQRSARTPAGLAYCWQGLDGASAADRLAWLGRGLWQAMFDEPTTRHLLELIDRSAIGTVVDMVVQLGEDVAGLPVELLRLPDGRLVATAPGVRVTRRLGGTEREPTPALPGPVKILAAVAAPEETATENTPLDVEAQMQALLDAVTDAEVTEQAQVRILEVASLAEITEALSKDQYHVLHLYAHGSPSGIELEDEDGNPEPVGADQLVAALRAGAHPLPVVVLSSCSGAADGTDGLAATLIRHGADRVLGMQTSVTEEYATDLARAFYRALASNAGCTVAAALATARRLVEEDRRAAARRGGLTLRPEDGVATLLAAGADGPLRDPTQPADPLSRATRPPAGGLRELPIGDLIGRRGPLRTSIAALRGSDRDRDTIGAWSGVALTGVGGIGKTALAGRVLARMRADGWLIAEHIGVWNPPILITAVATALDAGTHPRLADELRHPGIDDARKLGTILQLLRRERMLLLFDDFEQNLTPDARGFLDPGFAEIFHALVDTAETGRVLVTCRYPVPDADLLLRVDLPRLTPSELRRLFLRLPALRDLPVPERRLVTRTIGGHPRLIEFVDVLLRRGRAGSFTHVTRKLRDLARKNHLDKLDVASPHGVEDSVAKAVLLGSRDIVLDVLIDDLTPAQRELLWQASVSTAPFTSEDLLAARYGADTVVEDPRLAAEDVDRLVDLTLLSSAADGELLVHPWIAAALRERHADAELIERHRRAADMRVHRVNHGRGRFDDLVEVVRHLAGCHDYDAAAKAALKACDMLTGEAAISALLAEAVPLIPTDHPYFLTLADRECEALLRIGLLTATIERRAHMLTVSEDRATADPGNAGYQRDLSISHNKLGDVAVAGGDSSTADQHYRASLTIRERLATADPGNADYQRDLSISHNKLGNLVGNDR